MLVLPAELTLQQATACLAMLLQGLRAQTQSEVVVDASALVQFDSSAIAVLLASPDAKPMPLMPMVPWELPAKAK